KLSSQGIQTEVYYPRAMHDQECFASGKGNFPASTRLTHETLALPLSMNP
ncbi:MAG: aminotransferase DegT, partial [Bacteroidetes bacterium]|nr:aminotransferase DegT [Bacteroidota bacterium]